MRRKGFTLVELMVVVAIIAILAAVAVPMYTKFQQKSRVSGAIKAAMGTVQAFQDWYQESNDFSDLSYENVNGTINDTAGVNLGASLPFVEGMTWTVTTTTDKVVVDWDWGATTNCPTADCNGELCLACNNTNGVCFLEILMDAGSQFSNLNKDPGSKGACAL